MCRINTGWEMTRKKLAVKVPVILTLAGVHQAIRNLTSQKRHGSFKEIFAPKW